MRKSAADGDVTLSFTEDFTANVRMGDLLLGRGRMSVTSDHTIGGFLPEPLPIKTNLKMSQMPACEHDGTGGHR